MSIYRYIELLISLDLENKLMLSYSKTRGFPYFSFVLFCKTPNSACTYCIFKKILKYEDNFFEILSAFSSETVKFQSENHH